MKRACRVLLVAVAVCAILAASSPALAKPTFSGFAPPNGATVYGGTPTISAQAVDGGSGTMINPLMRIDGITVGRFTQSGKIGTFSYTPATPLSPGKHTAYVAVTDSLGQRGYATWSFTVSPAASLTQFAPVNGSTVTTRTPEISALVLNAGASPTFRMTVNGGDVPTSYDPGTGKIMAFPAPSLGDESTHTVVLTVTTAGGTTTASWAFRVETYPAMASSSCTSCHPTYPASHVMADCQACHYSGGPLGDCGSCHGWSVHSADLVGAYGCEKCHQPAYPPIPQHPADLNQLHVSEGSASCKACHSMRLDAEHRRHTDDAGDQLTCTSCHLSATPLVVEAIAANDTKCVSCHPDYLGKHYGAVDHVGDVGGVSDGHGNTCSTCHDMDLATEHERASSSSAGRECGTCHPTPKDTFAGAWNGTCAQAGCHTAGSSAPLHGHYGTAHTRLAANDSCFVGSGCHDDGDLLTIHQEAGDGTQNPCTVCHTTTKVPATKDCTVCHPDRVAEHGYEPALHMSDESCIQTCHAAELKPEHDSLVTPVDCDGCHDTKVDEIKPWDKSCGQCHESILHSTANHTGTDAVVRQTRGGYGCSNTAPAQTGCHDISNAAALHDQMPGKGCAVCHAPGVTPSAECRTCHPPALGDVSGVATLTPTADGLISAITTVNPTTPSTRFDKVDETVNDSDDSYIAFSGIGRAMFTSPVSIPSTAVISNIRVYYRARRLTASPLTSRLAVSINVGGTYYDGSLAQPATTYPASATYYQFTNNPKTGQPWRAADLLSPDGVNGLREFGVNATNVAPNIRVTQCYVVVNYVLKRDTLPLGGAIYHHNNVKYLRDPSDAEPGEDYYYAAGDPPHGWYDALYFHDCYENCHNNNAPGPADYTAYSGEKMWYSVAADLWYGQSETRNLDLATITVPATSPRLEFMTQWRLYDASWGGNGAGYVEVSTDGGATYTSLTGTVGGVARSSLTGNVTSWLPANYDLSAYAGQQVKLRFRYVSGTNSSASGWGFDELKIVGAEGTVFSDDAETLKPEWTNRFWTRCNQAWRGY